MSDLARLMLDNSPEMLLLVDPVSLQIVMANAPVAQTLGYTPEQLQGLAITEIESDLQDVFYWEDVRSGRYLPVQHQEGQYRRLDGDLLTVSKSVRVLEHQGSPLLMVQAVQTQSVREVQDALAQTLSQLRATLESTGNGILVLDWHGNVNSMNRLFGKMWELPESVLQSADNAAILDFVGNSVVEADLMRTRLRSVVDNAESEDEIHHKDGRVFALSSRPQYLNEQIIGRVFGFQDITQRTQDEAALRESRDKLEERVLSRTAALHAANETLHEEKERLAVLIKQLEETQSQLMQSERMASIGQLAAGIAHEINNPVGFVNSNLGSLHHYVDDMLRLLAAYEQTESVMPEAATQEIRRLKKEVDVEFMRDDLTALLAESQDGLKRVTRIVQDLKDFSHVDEAERQWSDLEAGIESTLRVVWNEVKYKADVVKEYGGIPKIECYPFQLNQVFMNLLVNAAHALEDKGTITVRTGHDDNNVWVQVQDTGKGIAPENLARIFDPFFTTKPVGKGTGLGLSLAYGIVKKHSGRIDVKSEVGQGSTFTVNLPKVCPPVK